jgi:hypothetical protein
MIIPTAPLTDDDRLAIEGELTRERDRLEQSYGTNRYLNELPTDQRAAERRRLFGPSNPSQEFDGAEEADGDAPPALS